MKGLSCPTDTEVCFYCVLVLCFIMGYVLQFGEIACKRIHYYYFIKLRIGQSEVCPYGTGKVTAEHLQARPRHAGLKHQCWTAEVLVLSNLFGGSLDNLQCMAVFVQRTQVSI